MPLRVNTPYGELKDCAKKFQERNLYFLGQYVFAGSNGSDGWVDADEFCLRHLPHCDEINRIVMLFADKFGMEAAMLEINGQGVRCTESGSAQFLLRAFAALARDFPTQRVEDLGNQKLTSLVRLLYPQPIFLPLLQQDGLILAGYDLLSKVYASRGAQCANVKSSVNAYGSFAKMIREYFEIDSAEEWFAYMDPDRTGKETDNRLRDCAKYLEGLLLIRQDMDEMEKLGTKYLASRQRCREQVEALIPQVKEQMQRLAQKLWLETPRAKPETVLALWHIDRVFPDDLSYGEMEGIYAALGREMSRYHKRRPADEDLDVFRLWQRYWNSLETQLAQIRDMLHERMERNGMDWGAYLALLYESEWVCL